MTGYAKTILPGLALCLAVTIAAVLLQECEVALLGQPYLEALVLAILIGVAVRTAWKPSPLWIPGINVGAKFVLEVAIVLLGASVSAGTILALGPLLIFGIAGIVAVALAASYAIARALGLPLRLAILIACGNSICGNSAIAARTRSAIASRNPGCPENGRILAIAGAFSPTAARARSISSIYWGQPE